MFRGFYPEDVNRPPEEYEVVYEEFRQEKELIYDLWRNQEGLEEGRMERTLDYLEDFYEILNDPRQVQAWMLNKCRRLRERL